MARTGSNALVNAIGQHPNIHCDYEIFHKKKIYTAGESPFTIQDRDSDPTAFIEAVMNWNRQRHSSKSIYGFKLFINHNDIVLSEVLSDKNWQKILLKRDNILDQYVSHKIAMQSAVWATNNAEKHSIKVKVQKSEFLKYYGRVLSDYEKIEKVLENTSQSYLTLSYADVAGQAYDKVFDFLGCISSTDARPYLAKQNSAFSADKIENCDQVKKWLKKEGLEHFWVE